MNSKFFLKFLLALLLLCSASVKASCEYQINQVGNFFFSASITVTNDGPVDITDFNVSFSFTDATTPNNVFSSGDYIETLSGSGPFTITAIAGNSGVLAANGGSLVLTIQGPGISNGGGLAVLDGSITGDLCGPSLPNEGLTIEKIIVSDDGGSASLDDFDISVNGVEVLWPTPASTSSDSVVVSSISGTYTLSEIDLSDYMEGTWACSDDSDGSFVPVTNGGTFSGSTVVVSAGQSVTCSITNDDDAVVVILPTEIIPSVCSIEPSTNRFQQAAQWLSSGGGTVGTLTATGSSVFASASPFVPGPGVSIDTSNTTTVITGATEANFTDAYLAGDFIDYTVETLTSLSNTSVVSGLVEFGGRDGTAPYQLDVLVSDDNFSTAVRLVSNHIVDTPGSFDFIADDLEQIYLSASTEYIFRIVFYDANPSTSNILMDDFAISVDNCTDHGDAAFITGSNDGGHFLPAVRTHFIGNVSPDAEFGVPADDNLGGEITSGEEAGVILPIFSIGQTTTVDVPVTGSTGLLNAWIDWDGDEVFDADERIATDATISGSSGTITLTVIVPADAVVGSSYGRFRWSPNSVLNPTDFVEEGELEDYPVTIIENIEPELTITKTTSTGADFAGNTADYTILVSNSVGDAVDVIITDTPENTGFTYASSSVTLNGGAIRTTTVDPAVGDTVMNWSSFTIPSGGSVEIALTVDVASSVPAGVYDNSVNITTSSSGATINDYDGTDAINTSEDVIIHQSSPLSGNLLINEVLYRATGNSSTTNDEFIELYNAGSSVVNLNGLMLIDGNKVTGDLDGTTGSITGDTMSFDFSCTGTQVCTGATSLAPGEYAVVWVGTQDLTNRNSAGASFQAWLGQTQKLANGADDVWLFGVNNEFIDYVAWGASSAAAVDTDYPPSVWDDSVQNSLDGNPAGASISLTPNGVDGNTSDCWEETTSTDASARCLGYLPTIDTDDIGTRVTSAGFNNNGGTIIIQKQTLPDGSSQSFNFTGDITASLTDGSFSTPVSVPAGTYTVTESSLTDWSLVSISCNDTDSTGEINTATATFNVVAGETIVCVFTNEQMANLTLQKVVNNTAGSAVVSDWTLEANAGGGSAEISGISGVNMAIAAGDYVLSEINGPSGYILDSLICDVGVLNTTNNTLTLQPGDESTCTFTNRDLITNLSINKSVDDANPSVGDTLIFTLTVTNIGPDDATNVVVNDTILDGFTFVSGSMTGGDTQNEISSGLVWNINTLPAGTTNAVTLTYQVIINSP